MQKLKSKITQDDVEQATRDFARAQAHNKLVNDEFNDTKKAYYSFMSEAFEAGVIAEDVSSVEFIDSVPEEDGSIKTFSIKSTRVVPTSIQWDIKKLKSRLDKSILRKVVKRVRTLVDLPGLVEYMKYLGGDPKIFWSFFETSEQVDQKEMDQASDLGYVSDEDVAGCFSVTTKPEYFRVSTREVKYDEDGSII